MQEEKGTTEDEMVGRQHLHDGSEFEQTPEVGGGQGSLACCSPLGHKESDRTEQLNSNKARHVESRFPDQVSNLHPLQWKWSLNHCTTKVAPREGKLHVISLQPLLERPPLSRAHAACVLGTQLQTLPS